MTAHTVAWEDLRRLWGIFVVEIVILLEIFDATTSLLIFHRFYEAFVVLTDCTH